MKKPCSTCDSIIVVNGKSLPNPQCHSCRAKARLGNCEECAKPMDKGKPSAIRRFCSPQCFGASGEGNRSRLVATVANCAWCDHPFVTGDKIIVCSRRCAGYLKMNPSRPWKPPRVVVPKVEYVNTCNDCGVIAPKMRQVCESCRLKRKRSKKPACRDCGVAISTPQQRCADCKEKALIVSKRKRRVYENQRKKIKGNHSNHRKRARKYGCAYEPVNRAKVFARDGYICHICGQTTNPTAPAGSSRYPSLDHIIPLSKQGGHSYSNVATACMLCNSLKRDLDLDEARLILDKP